MVAIIRLMAKTSSLPVWSWLAPVVAWCLLCGLWLMGLKPSSHTLLLGLLAAGMLGSVLAAVHHAEVIAHRVGEPYGTLLLAVAVTIIEVALIVSLMLTGGASTTALARDTVFAAVMIILNGMVGLCMLVGGSRFKEQSFGLYGVSASLATLAAIAVLTLVLPNYTTTTPGPFYSTSQLSFIAVVSVVLYGTFVMVQTVRHRDYFLPEDLATNAASDAEVHADPPSNRMTLVSLALLPACLAAVVLLAKSLAPSIESAVASAGAPVALVGVIIAAVVLLPEGVAALRAARANRLQTSLNLALGSALATIGLTIPAVAVVSIATGWTLTLGLDIKSCVLLVLSLFVCSLSLGTGRTTVLQGVVHLVIFAAYLFTTIVP